MPRTHSDKAVRDKQENRAETACFKQQNPCNRCGRFVLTLKNQPTRWRISSTRCHIESASAGPLLLANDATKRRRWSVSITVDLRERRAGNNRNWSHWATQIANRAFLGSVIFFWSWLFRLIGVVFLVAPRPPYEVVALLSGSGLPINIRRPLKLARAGDQVRDPGLFCLGKKTRKFSQ